QKSFSNELEVVHRKTEVTANQPWSRNEAISFLHDNTRSHVASTTVQKLHQQDIEVLPQPPYFSDSSPANFHLFHSLDNFFTQKRFRKQEDIENAFQQFLPPRNSDLYARGINALVVR
ncbi:Histone-lysine N-methyltransferase SETMAR, partial [Habropoda laboriosa]